MKLSVAALLGDTIMARNPNLWFSRHENCGCGIGRAFIAAGGDINLITDEKGPAFIKMWPWLMENANGTPWYFTELIAMIGYKFSLVCENQLTMEQFVDWIASIEPSCGDCNTRVCTCVQKMDEPATQAQLQFQP